MTVQRNLPTPIVYPSDMPLPLKAGYSVTLDYQGHDNMMESGWNRRRRMTPYTYRTAKLSFSMSSTDFIAWHKFVNDNASKWLHMDVQSNLTLAKSEPFLSSEVLRFISSIKFAYSDFDRVTASVAAEFFIDPLTFTPPVPTVPSVDANIPIYNFGTTV